MESLHALHCWACNQLTQKHFAELFTRTALVALSLISQLIRRVRVNRRRNGWRALATVTAQSALRDCVRMSSDQSISRDMRQHRRLLSPYSPIFAAQHSVFNEVNKLTHTYVTWRRHVHMHMHMYAYSWHHENKFNPLRVTWVKRRHSTYLTQYGYVMDVVSRWKVHLLI